MKIGAFIKFLPKPEKDTLAEDLRITLDELDKIVIPAYNSALLFLRLILQSLKKLLCYLVRLNVITVILN